MRQYLLVIRCNIDDVPVKMLNSEEDAIALGHQLKNDHETLIDALKAGADAMRIDYSTPQAVAMITFEDGYPKDTDILASLSCEEVE